MVIGLRYFVGLGRDATQTFIVTPDLIRVPLFHRVESKRSGMPGQARHDERGWQLTTIFCHSHGLDARPIADTADPGLSSVNDQSIPNFHDGYVAGLKVREGGATLYLQQVDGADFDLILEDLEALQIDDFRQGNIISHVDIIAGRLLSADALDRLYEPPHPAAAPQYHEKHASFVKGQVERIGRGEAQLLVIVPSYGADLLAICRQVHCVAA